MDNLDDILKKAKIATRILSQLDVNKKNQLLSDIANRLKENKEFVLKENKKDIENAVNSGKNSAFINRLAITDSIFEGILSQIDVILETEDPLGEIIEERELKNGINLKKVRVPIGVIAVIYESRPNVTIDVAALCIKSGNVAILKGGSEAFNTNQALVSVVQSVLVENGLARETISFISSTDRAVTAELLKKDEYIDLLVPRGGYGLARFVVENSTIPLLYHSAGGARIYIDKDADIKTAVDICVNAKVSRPATCNSLNTVVVHSDIASKFLPKLSDRLKAYHVEIRADQQAKQYMDAQKAENDDFSTEFLDFIISIKTVNDSSEAIKFIQEYSNGHSEGVISQNEQLIQEFIRNIDAAAVFVNCSTRFNDGAEFGLGAEIGIATGKLHARGPVGLKEITTYKWVAIGEGQIRK
jgi:glutamate-5-semialdehyde dehydrogenase